MNDKQAVTSNPAGSPTLRDTTPQDYKRDDFFRDPKKVAQMPDRPSRPDTEKR